MLRFLEKLPLPLQVYAYICAVSLVLVGGSWLLFQACESLKGFLQGRREFDEQVH